ncbi:Unknown protein sequence [Pseudomonas syringae pv. maculicola str. M6]|nr:Unknown protein sequence [Pseudomonas syringae pv. maculicola str. M6]
MRKSHIKAYFNLLRDCFLLHTYQRGIPFQWLKSKAAGGTFST